MHAAVIADPKPKRRRQRAEIRETMPHVPEVAERLRESAAEAVVRAIWLEGLTSTDIRGKLSSFRSCELAQLKAGDVTKFGLNKILNLASILGCRFSVQVMPPAVPARAPDDRIGLLFKLLSETDDACQRAFEDVGPRSYPLTRVAARQAGVQCMLAIEAIRRGPEFWHREALLFSAMLFSAETMLEGIKTKSHAVAKAISLLRQTATLMEDIADQIAEEREVDVDLSDGRNDVD